MEKDFIELTPAQIEERIATGREFMKMPLGFRYTTDQQAQKPQPPLCKAAMTENFIELPMDFSSLNTEVDFLRIINERESHRVYTEGQISLLQLSFLLWCTQGVKSIRGNNYATVRTVPCGGARHEFETYLLIKNVEGLKQGAYHYLPLSNQLEFLGQTDDIDEVISQSVLRQDWAKKASVIFYWSVVPYRAEWRYSVAAHRPALIDVGHVGQNLYLACQAQGLGTCALAAFYPKKCDELFHLDGKEEFTVYVMPVGTI